MEKIISTFGSSVILTTDELYQQVLEIGKYLAENGYTVCSGGYGGTMEAICKGAKSVNGKTIGVTVENWPAKCNKYVDENVIMANFMERLTELVAIGDAYIIFKGGSGTLLEFSFALELMNKKEMKEKPLIYFGANWRQTLEILKTDSVILKSLIERNVNFVDNVEEIITTLNRYNL